MQSELRQPSTEGAAIRTVQAQTAAMDVRVAENRERCRQDLRNLDATVQAWRRSLVTDI